MAELAANWTMWASFLVVFAAIGFYMYDRFSMELVSVAIIAGLLLLFAMPGAIGKDGQPLAADAILAGFGNSALITIMALLVVGQGLFQTGALDGPSRALVDSYDKRPMATLLSAFLIVFVTSAFINNTPVVVMFLPIMTAIAVRMGVSSSKVMIPLSFVSIFAGMTTLIGTSTNLLAAESYTRIMASYEPGTLWFPVSSERTFEIAFFDLTPIGLILAAVGGVYLLAFSRFLLPSRAGLEASFVTGAGKQFIAQIEITHGHPLVGATPIAGMFAELPDMTVRMIQRGEQADLPPFDNIPLRPGDLLIVAATRKALTDTLSSQPELLREMWQSRGNANDDDAPETQLLLTEAVVAPGSRMSGRAIEQIGFRRLTRTIVLGVQRRSRMFRTRLGEIRLEAGDTLLLCGPASSFNELRSNRDLLLLEYSQIELPSIGKSMIARLVTLGVVIAAATGILPILHASVLGAFAMIAFGCLNVRQASRALDLRIFLLIGAAIAMGTALEYTGAAEFLARQVVGATMPYGPLAVLSCLFLLVAIITNILSNSATAVIFTPIAVSAAQQIGTDPFPFVLAVIYAANCCFATPIAYQTNLLVMGPGHYKFTDYIKFGGPLVLVIWAAFTVIASWRIEF